MNREELARQAFWGMHPALWSCVLDELGVTREGVFYPAANATIAQCLAVVATLPWQTVMACLALDEQIMARL